MINHNTVLYQSLNEISTYLKCSVDNLLNKDFFIRIRDNFLFEYKKSCIFYNSSNVSDLIQCTIDVLNNNTKELINNNDNENDRNTIENQYNSLLRAIKSSYDNLNIEMIMNIIDCVSDIDSQKSNLILIIKGLILLQIIYALQYIVNTTIENNNQFNYVTEHKSSYFPEILEHISEIRSLSADLTSNITNLTESDEEEISFMEKDLYDDEYTESSLYNDDDELTYSSNDLNNYILKIYSKAIKLLKDIFDKIISNKYYFLPQTQFLMYITTIISMLMVNKF